MFKKIFGPETLRRMENKELYKLVRKASKGDSTAFEKIISLKSESILFNALSVMGNYHDAEDVAQEVVIKIYGNIKQLKDPETFNGWLQRIITNECYNIKRKPAMNKENISTDEQFENLEEEDREFLPQEFAESKEQRNLLKDIIQSLPDNRRRMVVMYYYDSMSYKEIAYALNISVSVIASNLSRAKLQIKKELEAKTDNIVKGNTVNKMATVPVLTQVLSEQASESIPASAIKKLIALGRAKAAAGAVTAGSTGFLTLKITVVALVSTAIVSAGTVATINNHGKDNNPPTDITTQQAQASVSEDAYKNGKIIFDGEDCDCGHVNPEKIQISGIEGTYNEIEWTIQSETGKIIASGTSDTVQNQLRQLYKDKEDGKYLASFAVDFGDKKFHIERDFRIDTGEIVPGQYQ